MPVEEQIVALTELVLLKETDFDTVATHNRLLGMLESMPTTLASWGERTADLLLGSRSSRWESVECGSMSGLEPIVILAGLFAMVRGGRPLAERYDDLNELRSYPFDSSPARAVLEAIPADRRERMLIGGFEWLRQPSRSLTIAMTLLPMFPCAALAERALAHLDEGKPKKVLQALGELAKAHPAITDVLSRYRAMQKPGLKLVVEQKSPGLEELDAVVRRQIELCAELCDERTQTAAELVACVGDEPTGPFKRTRIAEGGKPVDLDEEEAVDALIRGSVRTRLVALSEGQPA